MIRTVISIALVLLPGWTAGAVGGPRADGPAQTGSRDRVGAACDYGIAVAFQGKLARAESVFVQILSQRPGDARALTNLGNVSLLRDDLEVALAFYNRAATADSVDAGIVLNQAAALVLLGEEDGARERVETAIALAGGVTEAARLLGLRIGLPEPEAPKAADKSRVTVDEWIARLREAERRAPVDSLRAPPDSLRTSADSLRASAGPDSTLHVKQKPRRRGSIWRIAAPRARDPDATLVLYWKR